MLVQIHFWSLSLSLWNSNDTILGFFILSYKYRKTFFFSTIYSDWINSFTFPQFYWFYILLFLLYSWTIRWVFIWISVYFRTIVSICFYNFYFFAEMFYFSFLPREFIIAYWIIFMMVALKPLSDHSNIWFISILACMCLLYFFTLVIFLVLGMRGDFFNCIMDILDFIRFWILSLSYLFFLYLFTEVEARSKLGRWVYTLSPLLVCLQKQTIQFPCCL